MLEVATTCIEPVAHLFLRRIAPLVRSTRLLGPHFWHNGGHAIEIPPWWPTYLNTVRQIPQTHNTSTSHVQSQSQLTASSPTSERARRRPRTAAQRKHRAKVQHGDRAFSLSLRKPKPVQAAEPDDTGAQDMGQYRNHVNESSQRDLQQRQGSMKTQEDEPGDVVDTNYLDTWQASITSQSASEDPVDPRIEHLQNLLASDPKPELAKGRRDKAWEIWVTLSDQQRFASEVLRKHSISKDTTQLDRAMQAFSIIPLEERTTADYDYAITTAISRHRYAQAFQICDESIDHGMGVQPAQTLLLCCLRQRLWKNAARAWRSYFKDHEYSRADWSAVDNDPNIVNLSSRLLSRLNTPDVVLAVDVPLLKEVASLLVNRLTASSRIMGLITQEGILQICDYCRSLGILEAGHYTRALSTLCSKVKSRLRVDLALIIYRRFRFDFSGAGHDTFMGLLHLCSLARSKPETFRSLMREYLEAHTPELKAYNMVMMAMARQANVEEVEHYLREFTETSPHALKISILVPRIYVHAITGNVGSAKLAFDEIKQKYGLQPDTVCWNNLLYAHSRSNEPQKAFEIFDEMTAKGIKPDAYTFGTLTGIASNSGDTDKTLSLLELASQHDIPRTGEILASVVHSLCLNRQPEEAWNFAEQATRAGAHGSPIRMWNTLLRHYAFLTDARAVNKIQDLMRKLEIQPDAMTYAAVMTALVRKSRTAEALRLVRSLHFSGEHSVTAFHYSILVHGFAMEKNRDMALSIFKEMEVRFPRVSPSARLAMLYTQMEKDWDLAKSNSNAHRKASLELRHAEEMANDILINTSVADKVTKDPQPGFRRRAVRSALPSILAEVLVDAFMADAHTSQSQSLIQSLETTPLGSSISSQLQPENIPLLSHRLLIASQKQDWDAVGSIWNAIVARAVEEGVAADATPQAAAQIKSLRDLQDGASEVARRYKLLLEEHRLRILPAQRFKLSRPLTRLIQALEQQAGGSTKIENLVENLQACGFELSSKNWNTYIQALCKTGLLNDHFAAFELFESKFGASIPAYRNLFSSTWADPETIAMGTRADIAKRVTTEETNPGKLIPTYFTVVYLASALLKYLPDTKPYAWQLRAKAPKTYKFVRNLPYSADRIQGVLLRGSQPRGDQPKRAKEPRLLDKGGVVGSKAPLDQVSDDRLEGIRQQLSDRDRPTLEGPERTMSDLRISVSVEGEPTLSQKLLLGAGRRESSEELQRRLNQRHNSRVGLVNQMKQDLNLERLIADEYTGDPAHISKATMDFTAGTTPQISVPQNESDERAKFRTGALLGILEEMPKDTNMPEEELKLALHALKRSKATSRGDNAHPLAQQSNAPQSATAEILSRPAVAPHNRRLLGVAHYEPVQPAGQRQVPGAALLNRLLPIQRLTARQLRLQRSSRRQAIRARSNQLARSRSQARRDFLEQLKVRNAARRLLTMLPRFRDLTFQARIARKRGELARAQVFYDWAYDPVFKWSATIKKAAEKRKIYSRLAYFAPSLMRANAFELTLIRNLFQNPRAVMYEEMSTGTAKPLKPRLLTSEELREAQDESQSQNRPNLTSQRFRSSSAGAGPSINEGFDSSDTPAYLPDAHGRGRNLLMDNRAGRNQSADFQRLDVQPHQQTLQPDFLDSSLDGAYELQLPPFGHPDSAPSHPRPGTDARLDSKPVQDRSLLDTTVANTDDETGSVSHEVTQPAITPVRMHMSYTEIVQTDRGQQPMSGEIFKRADSSRSSRQKDAPIDLWGSSVSEQFGLAPPPSASVPIPASQTRSDEDSPDTIASQDEVIEAMDNARSALVTTARTTSWAAALEDSPNSPNIMQAPSSKSGADSRYWARQKGAIPKDDDMVRERGRQVISVEDFRADTVRKHTARDKEASTLQQMTLPQPEVFQGQNALDMLLSASQEGRPQCGKASEPEVEAAPRKVRKEVPSPKKANKSSSQTASGDFPAGAETYRRNKEGKRIRKGTKERKRLKEQKEKEASGEASVESS